LTVQPHIVSDSLLRYIFLSWFIYLLPCRCIGFVCHLAVFHRLSADASVHNYFSFITSYIKFPDKTNISLAPPQLGPVAAISCDFNLLSWRTRTYSQKITVIRSHVNRIFKGGDIFWSFAMFISFSFVTKPQNQTVGLSMVECKSNYVSVRDWNLILSF
jgi:hypothetical protein